MGKYEIYIGRESWKQKPYYISIRPHGQERWSKTVRTFTLWGAHRKAKKLVYQMENPNISHTVEEYEL